MISEKQRRVRIFADPNPESPRQWDNLGTMACWHRRYNLGDEQPKVAPDQWLMDLAIEACPRLAEIIDYWDNDGYWWLREKYGKHSTSVIREHVGGMVAAVLEKQYAILPLYLYDHSGITVNTTGFSCPWDSGQVGYIVCSLAKARENWGLDDSADWSMPIKRHDGELITLRKATESNLVAEVETYDQYIGGDVYGFVVEQCDFCPECGDGSWEETDSCWGFFGRDPKENGMADHLADPELVEMITEAEVEYLV